jgi:two-component system chemotaxis response regulator CheY
MKALVADDSAVMRRILIGALSRLGITETDEAENGEDAVVAFAGGGYGLVLLDWNMPKLNGFEALKKIRSEDAHVPIIMVTAEAEKDRVIEALKAGANNYVIKPFKPDVIGRKIEETLARVGSK